MTAKIKKDPTITKQHRMVIDIIHTANWLDDKISRILKRYGITHPQFNILKNVQAAHPAPLSIKEIRESIMFKNSDVTRLVDRLVNKELLQRNLCPENRRKMDVSITPNATRVLSEISIKFKEEMKDFFELEITTGEALKTSDILRKIRK